MRGPESYERLPMGWRRARFDEFLSRIERKIIIDNSVEYDCVGVRWYGLGAFVREHQPGMDIARKQQWVIKAGDIVYNKLFAWKGSFAIADASVDGCIVSDKFPTYEADLGLVNPQFLRYYFLAPGIAQQAQDLSKGAAAISKLTLNPPQFWDLTMPLPPLAEQQRIVARIEALASRIAEAQGLQRAAVGEAEILIARFAAAVLDELQCPEVPLGDLLCENSQNGLSINPSDTPPGTPILRISAGTSRSDGIVNEKDFRYAHVSDHVVMKYRLESGDLVACRFNGNLHYVGKFALYQGYSNQIHLHPDKLIRFRVNIEKVLPEFVRFTMNSPKGRAAIESFCATTAGNIGISGRDLKTIPIPVPPLPEQRRIVAYLDDLQARVDALKAAQTASAAELAALLPAVLDRAFKGEL